MLLRNADVDGRRSDVRVVGSRIAAVADGIAPRVGEELVDCRGGALLPGLHDHHCHLLAMAAAGGSVDCGPPGIADRADLAAALATAPMLRGWIRGVGYHEQIAGDLDRAALDGLRADVPVRVQHRSGALWSLNSAAVAALDLDAVEATVDGVERDGAGRATGRLWRLDGWLRGRLGPTPPPELSTVSDRLASYGVTGVTDATPGLDASAVDLLSAMRQRLVLLGSGSSTAPRKIVVADHELPSFDALTHLVTASRPRAVAVHCVTRTALVLTLAVLAEVGVVAGDRIEHAAVAPPDTVALLRRLGLAVVTQPSLPALRGDDYLAGVDDADRDHLWPFRSLLDAGVPVGCSSDAPYGTDDPWFAIRAAAARRTPTGRPIAAHERVSTEDALRGYLSAPDDPGGPIRSVAVGAIADLVVLDAPLPTVLADPSAERVQASFIGGEQVHRGDRFG